MYCRNCGKPLNESQILCVSCGAVRGSGNRFCEDCGKSLAEHRFRRPKVSQKNPRADRWRENDGRSKSLAAAGFWIFPAGFILYGIFKDKSPKRARSALIGAMLRCIIDTILTPVYIIAGLIALFLIAIIFVSIFYMAIYTMSIGLAFILYLLFLFGLI